MVKLYDGGVFLVDGTHLIPEAEVTGAAAAETVEKKYADALKGRKLDREAARRGTIAWSILEAHNRSGNMDQLQIGFDAMASHDITFVGIIQTARASGME